MQIIWNSPNPCTLLHYSRRSSKMKKKPNIIRLIGRQQRSLFALLLLALVNTNALLIADTPATVDDPSNIRNNSESVPARDGFNVLSFEKASNPTATSGKHLTVLGKIGAAFIGFSAIGCFFKYGSCPKTNLISGYDDHSSQRSNNLKTSNSLTLEKEDEQKLIQAFDPLIESRPDIASFLEEADLASADRLSLLFYCYSKNRPNLSQKFKALDAKCQQDLLDQAKVHFYERFKNIEEMCYFLDEKQDVAHQVEYEENGMVVLSNNGEKVHTENENNDQLALFSKIKERRAKMQAVLDNFSDQDRKKALLNIVINNGIDSSQKLGLLTEASSEYLDKKSRVLITRGDKLQSLEEKVDDNCDDDDFSLVGSTDSETNHSNDSKIIGSNYNQYDELGEESDRDGVLVPTNNEGWVVSRPEDHDY